MKKILYLFLITFTSLSCDQENAFDCVKKTGSVEQRNINVNDFHSISVNDNIDLVLIKGDEDKVALRTGKNLMSKIKFEIRDQVLFITNENSCNWVRKYNNPVVYCTVRDLNTIFQDGYGTISSEGSLNLDQLNIINYNGNGDIKLQVEVENLEVFSRSYALIEISGKATHATITYAYNHGKFDGKNLFADHVIISHQGLNSISVYPMLSLESFIGHSGNVEYWYEPQNLTSNISGKGQLIRRF